MSRLVGARRTNPALPFLLLILGLVILYAVVWLQYPELARDFTSSLQAAWNSLVEAFRT